MIEAAALTHRIFPAYKSQALPFEASLTSLTAVWIVLRVRVVAEICRIKRARKPTLSVAFTKEESSETASETFLPDRPILSEQNLSNCSRLHRA